MAKQNQEKTKAKVHKIKSSSAKNIKAKQVAKKKKKVLAKNSTKVKKVEQKPESKNKKSLTKSKKNFLFIIFGPIIKLIKYIKASFKELKNVRWPSRKETWQKVISIIIYGLIFIVLVLILDNLFDWLFKLMIGVK